MKFYRFLFHKVLSVFLFHDVTDTPCDFSRESWIDTPIPVFEKQLDFIQENFQIISPPDLLAGSVPARAALITFDDGFRSYFQNAVPILARRNISSLIFMNMLPVKGEPFWAGLVTFLAGKQDFRSYVAERYPGLLKDKLPLFLSCPQGVVQEYLQQMPSALDKFQGYVADFATPEDLKRAEKSSYVFLGNHLDNHYVPLLMTDEIFVTSLIRNQTALRDYANALNVFSFPFGQPGSCFTERHVRLAREEGVLKAFWSSGGVNIGRPMNFCLNRIALCREDVSFAVMKRRLLKGWMRGVRDRGMFLATAKKNEGRIN